MASILIRTIIIYGLLMITLRLMGRREIGQLDASDLVSTLLISELAAIPIDDPDIPLLNAILPILFILCLEVILSTIKAKSAGIGRVIDGSACYIIYKGRLSQKALRENRLSASELLSALRSQGAFDPSSVSYALLEQNGTISVLKDEKDTMAHPIVMDGKVLEKSLKRLGKSRAWLDAELKRRGIEAEDIFLMTLNDDGKIQLIEKEEMA